MTLALLAVTFNHDSTSASADALNIRRWPTTVAVPEWQAGSSFRHQDSVAAYSLADTRGNRITIQAVRVPRGGSPQRGGARTSDVRVGRPCLAADRPAALPTTPFVFGAFLPYSYAVYLDWQRRYLADLQRRLAGDAGSAVERRSRGGSPSTATAKPVSRPSSSRGSISGGAVGVHDVTWRWQFRRAGGDAWRDFGVSRHRVYGLLETPTRPWRQTPYRRTNIELPWTDVLDHACSWAAGASAPMPLHASRGPFITSGALSSSTAARSQSMYSFPVFDCTAFLERLDGRVGNGRYLNCSDCASIVATFANAGCDPGSRGWGPRIRRSLPSR